MTSTHSASADGVSAAPWGANRPAPATWDQQIHALTAICNDRGVSPAQVVVLVPYAQLMDEGRRAWARWHPDGHVPRFETTRNWAASLQPFLPAPTDLSLDPARDSLVASALLGRVVPAQADADLRSAMADRLVQSARPLAALAAAVPPEQRSSWSQALREGLVPNAGALHWEGLVGALALTWAGTSSYATDVLWTDSARPGVLARLLVVMSGVQPDPLASALADRWEELAVALPWLDPQGGTVAPSADGSNTALHACHDAEDEAQRAAGCVLRRIREGHGPVALVSTDRLLTRRISALLHAAGVTVHDETGWKLSTTYVAAQLMSLLRAASPRASMDDVLALIKHSPAWPAEAVLALEGAAREQGASSWRAAMSSGMLEKWLPAGLQPLLAGLQGPRSLVQWLDTLAQSLQRLGLWQGFQADGAGQLMLKVLRLEQGASRELAPLEQLQAVNEGAVKSARLSLPAFTTWVRETLEGASFQPREGTDPEVVIMPMAHLLGRTFAAAVVPGCDEVRLNPNPDLPGEWTAAAREQLGLPSRDALALANENAWQLVLQCPCVDLLWRTQEQGEPVLPSPWVVALQSAHAEPGAEPRVERPLLAHPQSRPMPTAGDLLPTALSASGYQDLRHCPYRFFALRQLRLVDAPELETEPDQRDLGNWLHTVLRRFHEQRGDARPGRAADAAELDRLAQETTATMGLNADESGAAFLPYEVVWPGLRDGYLDWLSEHEALPGRPGPRFQRAEAEFKASTGPWRLYGKLDRVDVQDSPEGPIPFVIDYKTESRATTLERLKEPLEDVQLAFYAALMPDDNLRAAYLSINDRPGTKAGETATLLVEHPDVLEARERLLQGLTHDLERIAGGHALEALGEGRVCEFCAARGLCRKDFWGAA